MNNELRHSAFMVPNSSLLSAPPRTPPLACGFSTSLVRRKLVSQHLSDLFGGNLMKALSILLLFFSLSIVSTSQTPSTSEKPPDVEILKFSWAEAPSRNLAGNTFPVLDASQRAPDRTGSPDLGAVEVRRKEQQTTTSAGDAINAK